MIPWEQIRYRFLLYLCIYFLFHNFQQWCITFSSDSLTSVADQWCSIFRATRNTKSCDFKPNICATGKRKQRIRGPGRSVPQWSVGDSLRRPLDRKRCKGRMWNAWLQQVLFSLISKSRKWMSMRLTKGPFQKFSICNYRTLFHNF